MPRANTIVVEGKKYITATEASKIVGGSRDRFYKNVKPYLRPYHWEAKQAPWYLEEEVRAIASGKPIRKASIAITGIFTNWTEHARSLGLNAHTANTEITVGPLPEDIVAAFHLPSDQVFVKRGRITFIDQSPICHWSTYYPAEFVSDILPQIQQGTASNVVEHIKDRHGVTVGKVKDRYLARITTPDELNQFHLLNDEPVLVLQRLSLTEDEKVLVFFSDMALLGSWFVIEREQEVHNWDR